MSLPLLGGQFVGSLLLFLQTPAGLFQLGQGVRGGIGWHCGILDEKMRRLDRVPELSTDPGVYGSRTLNRQGPGALMGLLLPHPRRPWGTKTSDCISSGSNKVCTPNYRSHMGLLWSFLLEECSFFLCNLKLNQEFAHAMMSLSCILVLTF